MPVLVAPYVNRYSLGRGRFLFNQLLGGVYQGFRPLGNVPEAAIEIEGEELEHKSSETGLSETDLKKLISVDRSMTLTCDNVSAENIAAFLGAQVTSVVQAAGTVTGELIDAVIVSGSAYQLGASPANVTGATNVSALTLTPANAAFVASGTYAVGQVVVPITPNNHVYYVSAITTGIAGATEPTWPTGAGSTIISAGVTFKQLLAYAALSPVTDYLLDSKNGLISFIGTIGAAAKIAPALRLKADYTRAANTKVQVATGASNGLEGQLKFFSENPLDGSEGQWFFPSVSLTPNGELPLITENELAQVEFTVGINKLNSSTSAIYKDNEPIGA